MSFYFFYLKHLQINTLQISESQSRSVTSNSLRPHGLDSPRNSPRQNTGVGGLFLLQGILPTQGLNPRAPALQADSLPAEPPGKPSYQWKVSEKGRPSYHQFIPYP